MEAIITTVLCFTALVTATATISQPQASRYGQPQKHWTQPLHDLDDPSEVRNATFTQPIDHNDLSLGTFEQWYWWNLEYWGGPGSPVVAITPGETNASLLLSLLTNTTLPGLLAQEIGAAVILIEHRYWGLSSPFDNLTTENLQYLTIDNSVQDLINFANNVELPWATPRLSGNADVVPWVLVGGSYSGALTAWVEQLAPGTYWAYLASSAVVETIFDFWRYFEPVQEGMPANCSQDVSAVIGFMTMFLSMSREGTEEQQRDLKAMFGAEDMEHNDDFMQTLVRFGPNLWQSTSFLLDQGFFTWCDFIEDSYNVTDPALLPGAEGVGLELALQGWADFWRKTALVKSCLSDNEQDCESGNATYDFSDRDMHDPSNPIYTDTTLANEGMRQWWWLACNEMGFFQTGAPGNHPSIVSQLVSTEYFTDICDLYFPPGPQNETYGLARGVTPADTAAWTGGWDYSDSRRIIFTNGEFDPWRESTVSANSRPGGPLQSTTQVPVNMIPGGNHCSDFQYSNAEVNDGVAAVQRAEIDQIKGFIAEWPTMGSYIQAGLSH